MEIVSLLVCFVVTLLILLNTLKYTYWRRRNVPNPTPIPIFGNYKDLFLLKSSLGDIVLKIYNQYYKEPFVGAYLGTEPVLIVKDLEMIKSILAKDFYYFSGRELVDHEHKEPIIENNVFSTSGDNWKLLRNSVNPMFSSSKLKKMFYLITESGKDFENYLDLKYKQTPEQDLKHLCTNFTLEVIGNCVFGLKFSAMSDEPNKFREIADEFRKTSNVQTIKNNIRQVWPTLYYTLIKSGDLLPRDVDTFFYDLAKKNFELRGGKPSNRNDLVDYLLKFKEQGFIEGDGVFDNEKGASKKIRKQVTDDLLSAQSMIFFGAGHETTALSLSFIFYEIAKHPKVQDKLVNEIFEVLAKHNNEITYDAILEMKYMDMVEHETLRKYPILTMLTRECVKDYTFHEHNLKIEKGMRIHIPVLAIHNDPKYYPEPEKFDPERFTPEKMQMRPQYAYMAFGEGQRLCLGMRFSKLGLAVGLITVLRKFKLEPTKNTPKTFRYDPKGFTLSPVDGTWLKLVPRTRSTPA